MTATMTTLASGDLDAEVPARSRLHEIGAMAGAVAVFRDNLASLHQREAELKCTNLHFAAALDNMAHGLAMFDGNEQLVVANARLCGAAGLPPGSLRPGMTFREVLAVSSAAGHFPDKSLDDVYAERRNTIAPVEPLSFEEIRGDRVIAFTSRPMSGGGCVLTVEDITERRKAEARIAHMAHHDSLTGLPNRVLFRERIEEALVRARRGQGFALFCLDLDRFKGVNDTLGHLVGDALLRAVTARLCKELRETDTVARLGGDEFAILQSAVDQPAAATALAQRLVDALGAPYEVDGHRVVVGASIGVALAPGDADDGDELLKSADLALYRAKADGRGAYRFFEPEMDARIQARRLLELDLRHALAAQEFELHYQPLIDPRTRRPTGFEALLRWCHPERGLVPPAEFIPLAEEIGLIVPIGEWVLRRACAEATTWPEDLKIAVNLSATQFRAGCALATTVSEAFRISGLAPDRLDLEVTEGVMLTDSDETLATLHRLRAMGVSISMDDFGTGYSSLSYLSRFPFDRIKIDRSFVRGLAEGREDCAAIVRAVVGLCGSLGMAITAEGVETEEQLHHLTVEGCTEVQGYFFSRPVPASDVQRLLGQLLVDSPAILVSAPTPALCHVTAV